MFQARRQGQEDKVNNVVNKIIDGSKVISLRGRVFTGTVTSTKMANTITVEWQRSRYIPKYERYDKRRTRVHAHMPAGAVANVGDIVKIMETRPISKTKSFIFVENLSASGNPGVKKEEKKTEVKAEKPKKTVKKKESKE